MVSCCTRLRGKGPVHFSPPHPVSAQFRPHQGLGISSDGVCAFDASLESIHGPLMQPHQRLLDLCQRNRVFAARKRTTLESFEAVLDNCQQCFVGHPIDADLWKRTVLETNRQHDGWRRIRPSRLCRRYSVQVIRIAVAWLIHSFHPEHAIQFVYLVAV